MISLLSITGVVAYRQSCNVLKDYGMQEFTSESNVYLRTH